MKECGSFVEKEFGHQHWYAISEPSDWRWEKVPEDFKHLLLLQFHNGKPTQTRFAKIQKTVAYIIVDEDDFGNPVIEKWQIKQHRNWEDRL